MCESQQVCGTSIAKNNYAPVASSALPAAVVCSKQHPHLDSDSNFYIGNEQLPAYDLASEETGEKILVFEQFSTLFHGVSVIPTFVHVSCNNESCV